MGETPSSPPARGRRRLLLRDPDNGATWQQWLLLAVALASAVGMRYALAPNSTGDYEYYMGPWLETLRAEGFAALGTDFANYNPPFLYLLYLGTFLPVEYDLTVVKLVAGAFDVVLALGVAAIAHRLRGSIFVAAFAGVGILFVPEVFLNSAFWGQVDAIYTSLLVWAMYFLLRRRDVPAWVLFGLAFSFKLQALFFLPWMAVAFIVQRHRWRAVAAGVGALLLTYLPSLLAGRSVASLAGIYAEQTSTQPVLAANVTNMYQWVPQLFFDTVFPAGVFFALGVVALLCALYLRRGPLLAAPETWLLQVGAAIGVVVPFVLPEMHDRYFYAGGVFTLLCILLDRRYVVPALLLQVTALTAYSQFLFNDPVMPLRAAAFLQLIAVVWVVALSLVAMRTSARPLLGLPDAGSTAPGVSSRD